MGSKLTHTVSGNLVVFLSADKSNIDSLKANFLPVQEGTGDPSPSNVRPITGCQAVTVSHHNRNLINPADYVASDGEKSIVVENNGLLSKANWFYNLRSYTVAQSRILAAKFSGKKLTFTITAYSDGNSLVDDGEGLAFVIQHDNGSTNNTYYWLNSDTSPRTHTFTVSGLKYFFFSYSTGGANYWHVTNFQVEIGEDATDFMPYACNTYAVTFPNEIGTVYGGSLDLVSGTLTVTHYGFDPQYCPDIVLDSTTSSVTIGRIKFDTNHLGLSKNNNCIVSNRFSNALPSGTVGRMAMLSQASIYYVMATSELATIDHAGFVQWFKDHPTVFVYELDTPQTIQLTSSDIKTFIGKNVVLSNANGNVDATYEFVDYLNRKRMFIGERMILPPEYQKTDYIQSNGSNARMSTGVPGDDTTLKITGEFVITEATGSYEGVFGNYKSESADCCWRIIFKANNASDYSSSFWVTPGSGAPSGTYGVTAGMSPVNSGETFINVRILFNMEYGKCTLIGTKTHSVNFSTKAANANSNPIAIGGSNVSSTGGGKKIKYYKFSMKSHGVLIREYIPCYRKSDNKAGFYDLVNHTFNPSIGTVEFIAGNDT